MDDHVPHDDDGLWITTSEMRYQQLLRKDAHPESVLSEKDTHSRQALRLQTSSDKKNELKAGISCNLCYIITSDNALMEQHLMGPAHVRNVEKEDKKFKEKIEFQKNSSVSSKTVNAIANEVEVSHCLHDEIVKSVIENRNVMDDTHCDEPLTSSMKNQNNLNEVIVVEGETTDEMNNCELCKYFQRDDGEFQKYQIPEHFCQNFYKSPELPAGWTCCSYYVNNVTKVKQWQWPTQPAGTERSGTAKFGIDKQAAAKDELAHGWIEKKAKSNGLPFYVNKLTNDWQWDRPTNSLSSKVTGEFSTSTLKDAEKCSVNSPVVTKAGMMVSKLKVTNSTSKEEALASNEVEKLTVISPIMAKRGEMISNLNESGIINQEDQLKADLMHWKQVTEQWNNL